MAQSPVVVPLQDLNTGQVTREAVTGGVGISGGRVVFRGTDSERGEELWIVDGSVAKPAAEVRPGPESSFPDGFAPLGTDYFTCVADDGVTGPEVRVLTVGGSLSLSGWAETDLRPGADHTAPVLLGSGSSIVWYAMDDLSTSGELSQSVWAFTPANPPIRVGSYQRGSVQQASVVPGTSRLCFIARPHSAADLRLFTASGLQFAVMLASLGSPAQAEPLPVPVYAATTNFVCFRYMSGGPQLLATTFSNGQTVLLQQLGPSVTPWPASNGVDRVCFAGYDSTNGIELWVTAGTVGTTVRLTDIAAGAAHSYPSRIQMVPGSNKGVFFQTGAEGGDRSLQFVSTLLNPSAAQEVTKQCHLVENLTLMSEQEIAFSRSNEVLLGNGTTGVLQQLDAAPAVLRLWHPSQPSTRGLNWLIDSGSDYRVKVLGSGTSSSQVAQFNRPAAGGSQPQVFQGSPVNQIHLVGLNHSGLRELRRFDGFSFGSAQNIPLQASSQQYSPYTASSHPADFFEIDGQLVLSAIVGGRRVLFFSHTAEPNSFQVVEALAGPAATPGAYDVDQVVKLGSRLFLTGMAPGQTSGERRLFTARYAPLESSYGGVVVDPVTKFGQPVEVTSLCVAAGKVFFVTPGSTTEELRCVDEALQLTTVGDFDKDSAGTGIADLVAAPGRLFFSAMASVGPMAGQRTIWSSTGTANAAESLPVPVVSPRLLGAWGSEVVFWSLISGGNGFQMARWTGNNSDNPTMLYQNAAQEQPMLSRDWRRPSGLDAGTQFFYANQLGQLVNLFSTGGGQAIGYDPLQVIPEHLALVGGDVLYHRLARNHDYWGLFAFDGTSEQPLTNALSLALPGPLIPHGGRVWYSRLVPGNPPRSTELWSSDGTFGTQQPVATLSPYRAMVMNQAGTFRGHLVFGGESWLGSIGIEPCLLNTPPTVPAPPLLTGAQKGQPYTFTYAQIVTGPATDADGDTVSAPSILPSSFGELKRNGSVITVPSPLLPGDTFEWTPGPDLTGNMAPAAIAVSDPWSPGITPVLIRVATPLDEWMQGHFTPAELADPAIGGINADSDGDGVTNGLEFLFGRHPRNQEAEAGTTFSGGPQLSGARRAVFSFIRTATLTPGAVLEIDQSADLSYWWTVVRKDTNNPWNAFYPDVTVDEQTQPDGRIKTTVTIDEWVSEPRFLRLRMTVP
ncbi:MAG: hypothetical protein HS117_27215 [Verrucomicrobiaceae bacterium]|nr:hypothetical protein [Verrucomicrobiaceae bacterium]